MRLPPLRPDDETAAQREERQRRAAGPPWWIDPANDEAWCGQPTRAELEEWRRRTGRVK